MGNGSTRPQKFSAVRADMRRATHTQNNTGRASLTSFTTSTSSARKSRVQPSSDGKAPSRSSQDDREGARGRGQHRIHVDAEDEHDTGRESEGNEENKTQPKALREGFWAPGWLLPGELGTPHFESWPDKMPPELQIRQAGRVIFGVREPHLHLNAAVTALENGPTRLHTHEPIVGSVFLPCRLTRLCIGYQRPREMWKPLHHFCYLRSTRGIWVAIYLYFDNMAVCPSDHKLQGIQRTSRASIVESWNEETYNSLDLRPDASQDAKSDNDNDSVDDEDFETMMTGDGKEQGIHTYVSNVFCTAFHVYRLTPEEAAQTTVLPIYLLPRLIDAVPERHHDSCRRFGRLMSVAKAGRHKIDIEVRVFFEDGNNSVVGYHPASKTVTDNFAPAPKLCLGPSEILARGECFVTLHRKDRKSLVELAGKKPLNADGYE